MVEKQEFVDLFYCNKLGKVKSYEFLVVVGD